MRAPDAPQADSPFWWVWERFTDFHTFAYKASGGRIGGRTNGMDIVLIESVGRKSGKRRTHPLQCREVDGNLVIVASKGGVNKHPAWYLNLKANPDTTAWWKGEKRHVRARETSGEERQRCWDAMAEQYPTYNHYQSRTDRQIPVLVLESVDS